MTITFNQGANNIVAMNADDGNRYAGGLHKWQNNPPNRPNGNTVTETLRPTGSTWDKSLAGRLTFRMSFTVSGNYDVLFRAHTNGRDCWMWVVIDGNVTHFGEKDFGRLKVNRTTFGWHNGGGNNTVNLSAGIHTLEIYSITSGIYLDRIALVPTGSTVIAHGQNGVKQGQNTSGQSPVIENETFEDWLLNPVRDPDRVMLAEMDHADGTVRLASQPWISDEHLAYDDWIVGEPYLDNSLDDDSSVGDLEAVNPHRSEDWMLHSFSGFSFRWFLGDQNWPKSRFRQIATGTIEDLKRTGDKRYRFDLISDAQRYNRAFTETASTETRNADDAVSWIMGHYTGAASYQFINFTASELNTSVKLSLIHI